MMQKDNNNAIAEKLSQNDADVVTKRQASEIEKRAALAFVELLIERLHDATEPNGIDDIIITRSPRDTSELCDQYREAYDYAKSIGAIQ